MLDTEKGKEEHSPEGFMRNNSKSLLKIAYKKWSYTFYRRRQYLCYLNV